MIEEVERLQRVALFAKAIGDRGGVMFRVDECALCKATGVTARAFVYIAGGLVFITPACVPCARDVDKTITEERGA